MTELAEHRARAALATVAENGPVTIAWVAEEIGAPYTSTYSVLEDLCRRGLVAQRGRRGRAYIYDVPLGG